MMSLERLMLDHSPSMMLLVEPTQLQIVMANRGACQTLGYPEEALAGDDHHRYRKLVAGRFLLGGRAQRPISRHQRTGGAVSMRRCLPADGGQVGSCRRTSRFAAVAGASARCAKRAPGRSGAGADALAIAGNSGIDRQRHSGDRLAGADRQHEPPVQRHVAHPRRPPA
jgi:PAS domain-containing protein